MQSIVWFMTIKVFFMGLMLWFWVQTLEYMYNQKISKTIDCYGLVSCICEERKRFWEKINITNFLIFRYAIFMFTLLLSWDIKRGTSTRSSLPKMVSIDLPSFEWWPVCCYWRRNENFQDKWHHWDSAQTGKRNNLHLKL